MYCNNCDSELNENDKYCNVVDFNEKFIKSYIGDKADEMYNSVKNGGINIWAILFGIGYFAYRKMYLISIIIVVLGNIVGYLIPSFSSYIWIIVGLMFCPIYKWDITRKLRKIKVHNSDVDESQLLSIAQNKGGTSIIGSILFFGLYILIIIFI